MARVIFRNSDFRRYRVPFYDELCKYHNVRFVFKFNEVPSKYEYISVQKGFSSFWKDRIFLFNYFKWLMSEYEVFVASIPNSLLSALGMIIAKLRGKKVIIWVEGWLPQKRKGIKKKVKYLFQKLIFQLSDSYYVTSSKAENFVRNFASKDSPKIYKVLQANTDMKKYIQKDPHISLPSNYFVFLYFGRIIYWKGLDILLEAFHKMHEKFNDILLIVVGDGPFKPYCEELIIKKNIPNVHFYPAIDDNDNELKVGIFNLCDVFVLPSTIVNNQTEGWGLTVGEAMSLSKPVLVTDAVGCADDLVVNNENGYVVKHGNPDALMEAMIKFYMRKDKLSYMSNKSRQIYEDNISYQKMAEVLNNAINGE